MNINKLYKFSKKHLYPLNRSITGDGVRKSLKLIKINYPKLKIKHFRSNTKVFDWRIPPEWNVSEAYIKDSKNNVILDFKKNNLHLVGYSIPTKEVLTKNQLLSKLYCLPDQPTAIPYVTSYYKKNWGFCCTYNQKRQLVKNYKKDDLFKVVINSKFKNDGKLNYAEYLIKGKLKKEILVSTYICHPSMANNELSGPIVCMALISFFEKLKKKNKLTNSIRFLFIPETIGSISYIYKNLQKLKKKVIGGYVLSCIGDDKNHSCMFSKRLNSPSNEAIIEAYKKLNINNYKVHSFLERGSDERQYNSPGVDLDIASIFRSKYGTYKEYHTSLDNFNFVTVKGLKGGFNVAKYSIMNLDKKILPLNKFICEPRLGKRGLYSELSIKGSSINSRKYLDFLQYSNGKTSLEKISKEINLDLQKTKNIYKKLFDNGLLF